MPKVEFLFDFGSPNAYLCHRVIPAIEKRTGVRFDYVPILLGGIFKATGNTGPAFTIPAKMPYMFTDLARLCRHYGGGDYPTRDRARVSCWVEVTHWHGWGEAKAD